MEPCKVKEIEDFKTKNIYPPNFTKSQRYILKRTADSYLLKDGELHYQCLRKRDEVQNHLARVVCSLQEADIFIEFHASAVGAHWGVDKTMHAIPQRFYWPGMKADLTK